MKDKPPVCNKCKSSFVYVTKEEIVCRRCGNREKIKTPENQARQNKNEIC